MNINNQFVEKIEFLPDEYEIDVIRSWCESMIKILEHTEDYFEELDMMRYYVHSAYVKSTNYVTISVGNIKRIIEICGCGCFCCIFPYNYEMISSDFLNTKLGNIKSKIDSLLLDDNIDEAINLALELEDIHLKKLSLLYIKHMYKANTQRIIDEFKNVRRKSIHKINEMIYN